MSPPCACNRWLSGIPRYWDAPQTLRLVNKCFVSAVYRVVMSVETLVRVAVTLWAGENLQHTAGQIQRLNIFQYCNDTPKLNTTMSVSYCEFSVLSLFVPDVHI